MFGHEPAHLGLPEQPPAPRGQRTPACRHPPWLASLAPLPQRCARPTPAPQPTMRCGRPVAAV
eukprot:13889861-Alexandrium_andersonii.AAC.1